MVEAIFLGPLQNKLWICIYCLSVLLGVTVIFPFMVIFFKAILHFSLIINVGTRWVYVGEKREQRIDVWRRNTSIRLCPVAVHVSVSATIESVEISNFKNFSMPEKKKTYLYLNVALEKTKVFFVLFSPFSCRHQAADSFFFVSFHLTTRLKNLSYKPLKRLYEFLW